jgi:hypothetical protein
VGAKGSANAVFWRAIEARNVVAAEAAAREATKLPLDAALALVRLYGDRRDRRYERAALRYLERYIVEAVPTLEDVAMMASLLAERKPS